MSLITPFDPWENSLCTCPFKYSLSAYTGCVHGCLYCYASSYIRNFSLARAKKDFLARLKREIKKIPQNSIIALASSSDPYQPLEKKLRLTRESLKIFENYKLRINIVTKSSLILEDSDILRNLERVTVSISLTTLDEKLAKKLEPYGSSPNQKLKAIEKLSKYIPVIVRFDPLIYELNTSEIPKIVRIIKSAGAKQIITSTYKMKPDNFKRMLKIFPEYKNLWEKLYLAEGEKRNGYVYLPEDLRKKLITFVRLIALEEKLKFSCCREGFANLNTANCDGNSLLD